METIDRFLQLPQTHFFLFGPRGTGKSTWLKKLYGGEAIYIDLLSPDLFRLYSTYPERLKEILDARPKEQTVIIDEIQKVPGLLTVIHQLVEQSKNFKFILTGSSARKLKKTGADLLAGRALLKILHPFMASELKEKFNLTRALSQGLLPLVWSSKNPDETLKTYISLYLREEIQMEGLVRNIGSFSRFLEAISFSHASVLNTTQVAREAQIERKTVEGYIDILEDLLLAYRLPVFAKRAKRHLIQHRKFYFFDAGVYKAIRPMGPFDTPEIMAGASLEGLILQHLKAFLAYSSSQDQIFYWRTKSGVEVDFVVYGPKLFTAIEVKNTKNVYKNDIRGLLSFKEDYPNAQLLLLYRGKERLKIEGVKCLPCEDFLLNLIPGQPIDKSKDQ